MFQKAVLALALGAGCLSLALPSFSGPSPKHVPLRKKPRPTAVRLPSGSDGLFGATYSLEDSFKITLKSAEYTVARVNVGPNTYLPKAAEKLLVLHYSIQNPQPYVLKYDWKTIPISVWDAQYENCKPAPDVGQDPAHLSAAADVAAGQSEEDLYAIFTLPAAGAAPKLVVEAGRTGSYGQAITYTLTGQVKALAAPFADPKDPTGATALTTVPAQKSIFYPLGNFDARLDSVSFTTNILSGNPPDAGQRYLQAIFTIQNKSAIAQNVSWDDFEADLRDANGGKVNYNQNMLLPTSDDDGGTVLDPDAATQIRFFWALPDTLGAKTILLSEGDSRTCAFDVSDAK